MKFVVYFITFFSMATYAGNRIEVPFNKVNQSVVIVIEKSRCSASGEKAYTISAVVPDQEYKLVCKLRPPIDQYDSSIPIRLIEGFQYPQTILQDIQLSSFEDVKKQGTKAIRREKHSWGVEYVWATLTEGTTSYTYLCPKKSKHCFRVVHGGIEFLKFDLKKK